MKSVFNKIEKEKSKDIVFPVLAEHIVSGIVVLFTNNEVGFIIKGDSYSSVGDFSNNFVPLHKTSTWRILSPEESIVLSND